MCAEEGKDMATEVLEQCYTINEYEANKIIMSLKTTIRDSSTLNYIERLRRAT